MTNVMRFLGAGVVFPGLLASGLGAQTLAETCPELSGDAGGLIGYVVDSDSETVMPAATVTATWTEGEARADSGFDGVYRLCGVPVGVSLVLQAGFAAFAGETMEYTMAEAFERIDLGISMLTAAVSSGGGRLEDRILMCPDMEFPRQFLCREGWHLERCEYEDKGRIVARRTGSGTDNKEIIDQFVIEAERADANAILNPKGDLRPHPDNPPSGALVLFGLEGLAVKLVDPNCRN
jgi:hypothetical protein